MDVINGQFCMTKADLLKDLEGYGANQIIFAVCNEGNGKWSERPIYKSTEDCDETEIYLCLGDDRVNN